MKYDKEERIKRIAEKLSDGDYREYGHELRLKCPNSDNLSKHPKKDSSPSFFINLKTGEFHCFGCGLSGGYKKLLKISGSDYYPEIEEIEGRLSKESEEGIRKSIELPENMIPSWIKVNNKIVCVSKYLKQRRVPAHILKKLNIQISKSYGLLNNAIVYPIKYKDISFYGARITDKKYIQNTPYFYPRGSPKERVLYRIEEWYKDFDSIILVEGIFDYIRMLSYGYEFTVPLFGKSLSEYQIKDLIEMKIRKMYIMLDSDAVADSIKIGKQNMRLFDIYICNLKSKDPDLATKEEITISIDSSQNIINFL